MAARQLASYYEMNWGRRRGFGRGYSLQAHAFKDFWKSRRVVWDMGSLFASIDEWFRHKKQADRAEGSSEGKRNRT
jgi:hypothetical protein